MAILSFLDYVEDWMNVPAGETNADDTMDSRVRSKYRATTVKDISWKRQGKKSPEQRFGFMKKCPR